MSNIVALRKQKDGDNKVLSTPNNQNLYNYLFKNNASYSIVSSSPKAFTAIHKDDIGENFYLSEPEMDAYLEGFHSVLTTDFLDKILTETKIDDETLLDDAAIDDDDIKLSLYRSFRSLYDKWISRSSNGETGYFFNNYGDDNDKRSLIQHFNFVNRGMSPIGHLAAIDVAQITDIGNAQNGEGPTESLYQVMTGLLAKNNFDFFSLPNYIEHTNDGLVDMFKPFSSSIGKVESKPSFICMYIGGNSRTLDIPRSTCSSNNSISFEYVNDTFDLNNPTTYPKDITDGLGITAFRVRYGQETQNHFSKLELDQQEFKETQESLMVIDALTNPEKGNSPSRAGKGNNIYDMYVTRGYSCGVTSMGNAMIQPLMYFKLENVPMFRGTYLITNVTHDIGAHSFVTNFKGTRQPLITAPIVTSPISLLDLALSENAENAERRKQGKSGSSTSLSDVGGYSSENISVFNSEETNAKGCEIIGRLKESLGITENQAAGIIGNLIAESGLIPNRIQGSGVKTGLLGEAKNSKGDNLGYSWAQWTSQDRKDNFKEYSKSNGVNLDNVPATDEVAYGFLVNEIKNKYTSFLTNLKKTTTLKEAIVTTILEYEKPAKKDEAAEQNKRASFAQNVLDFCKNGTSDGEIPNITNAENVIVGSSSVATLNSGNKLVNGGITLYINKPKKTLSWLYGEIKKDGKTYDNVANFFQTGIGTNEGYPINPKKIEEYTKLIKEKFPKAKLYVLPGTRGWGNAEVDLDVMKKYYKQYTGEGWVLLWPKENGTEIDPNFSTVKKAHDANGAWFKGQRELIINKKS